MKKSNYYLALLPLFAIFFVVSSCSSSRNVTSAAAGLKDIVIDTANVLTSRNALSKVYDITIESDGNKSPRFYGYIINRNDSLFILDNVLNYGVYVYSKNGAQLACYNNIGKGEKQYQSVFDFTLGSKYIYIDDLIGHQIVSLDLQGNYIGSQHYKRLPMKFYVDESNVIVYGDNNNETSFGRAHCLYVYEGDSIIKKFLPILPETAKLNTSVGESFFKVGNEIHYYTGLRDTIYSIDKNSIRPIYHLNFGEAWPTKEFLKKANNKVLNYIKLIDASDYVDRVSFYESEKILTIGFNRKGNNYIFIYNKRNRRHLLYVLGKFEKIVGLNKDNLIIVEKGYKSDKIVEYKVMWDKK